MMDHDESWGSCTGGNEPPAPLPPTAGTVRLAPSARVTSMNSMASSPLEAFAIPLPQSYEASLQQSDSHSRIELEVTAPSIPRPFGFTPPAQRRSDFLTSRPIGQRSMPQNRELFAYHQGVRTAEHTLHLHGERWTAPAHRAHNRTPIDQNTMDPDNSDFYAFPPGEHTVYRTIRKGRVVPDTRDKSNATTRFSELVEPSRREGFNFSVNGLWKSNSSVMKWITEVPSLARIKAMDAKDDAPPEPTEHPEQLAITDDLEQPSHPNSSGRPQKRQLLDSTDASQNHDNGDDHCDKRAKTGSVHGPTGQRPRSKMIRSTVNVTNRLSDRFCRLMSPFSPRKDHHGGTNNPPEAVSSRMRFIFVGDSGCGKSAFLMRVSSDTFTEAWTPTHYELFNKTVTVDGEDTDLEMWDTAGNIELHQLSLLSYMNWDAVFICYPVNSAHMFENARTQWVNEIRQHCGDAPVFLLGLKKDARVSAGFIPPLVNPATRIGASEGAMAAHNMDALKYMECSAKTGDGVERIIHDSTRIARSVHASRELLARENEKEIQKKKKSRLSRLSCF